MKKFPALNATKLSNQIICLRSITKMTICGGSASELREVRSPKSYMFRFFQLINESVKSKGIQMTGPLDPIHDLIGVVYTVK